MFFGHISGRRFTAGLFWQFGPYGPEAVNIFFVLSGFVIAYVADTREQSARSYAISRAARIYSVAIPALVVTFILDAFGRAHRPWLYNASWHYVWHGRISQIAHALTFLNQVWSNNLPPGSDFPYWSLGYEVWYYVFFGVILFTPKRWRLAGMLAVLLIIGPRVAASLPIWLLGVLAYRVSRKNIVGPILGSIFCFGSLALWGAYEVYAWKYGRPIGPKLLSSPPVIQGYIIGTFFFFHLIGFQAISSVFARALAVFEKPIRWLAGGTLTLYLFHVPLSQFLAAETPWPASAWQTRLLIFGGVPIIVFVIAHFTERRKDIWRRGFEALFDRARPRLA